MRRERTATSSGPSVQEWRGVKADDQTEVSAAANRMMQRRSRALLWSLLRPFRHLLWLVVLVVALENGARLAIPWLVSRGIDQGAHALHENNMTPLLVVLVAMGVAVLVQAFSQRGFWLLTGRIGQSLLLELRRKLFTHFQKLDVAFHDSYTSGRAVSRLTSDIDAIAELLSGGIDTLIRAVLTLVGVSTLLILLDPKLGLVCLLSVPFMVLLVWWFSVNSTKAYRKVREKSAAVIMQFVETMSGIRAVEAYRRERRNQLIFRTEATDFMVANVRAFRLMAVFMPGTRLLGNVMIAVVLMLGGIYVIDGQMTVGVLAAFLLYLRQFFAPMGQISQFYNTFQSASSALEKISGVLEEEPAVVDPVRSKALVAPGGRLDFDDVGFEYVPGRPVIPGLDLHIPAGQTVALVGTTGAGKTTIAKLVARFYDPTSGRVRLDGVDLRELSDNGLRQAVVMLNQENFMFDGSVGDNIRVGRPDATDEQIAEAARALGADTFIEALPDGYDSDVGKRGGRLSAGQRQLIAFARVLLADPEVLILDEATSSLDIPSERLVQQALQTVLQSRTAIIIAHRLSTVEIADRVLVLEHGRVLEDGSPAELIGRTDGHYASLHQAWEGSLA